MKSGSMCPGPFTDKEVFKAAVLAGEKKKWEAQREGRASNNSH